MPLNRYGLVTGLCSGERGHFLKTKQLSLELLEEYLRTYIWWGNSLLSSLRSVRTGGGEVVEVEGGMGGGVVGKEMIQ